MKLLSRFEILEALAKAIAKPCMLVEFDIPEGKTYEDLYASAPWMREIAGDGFPPQAIFDGFGIVVCQDEAEMGRIFGQTECDRPPRCVSVYALTCGADGQMQDENT